MEPLRVKDLGEQGLLKILQSYCPPGVVGDDGAIVPIHSCGSLVVTTDVLVEQVHFSDVTTAPYDVGWRATAANLSDLAAMGADPLGITVGLSLPKDQLVSWVEQVYQGIAACLERYDTPLVGGDVCRSVISSLAISAFGEVQPGMAILRSAARPGDVVLITGWHGLSRGGLELLLGYKKEDKNHPLTASERLQLIAAHQRPLPRLDLLPLLNQLSQEVAIAGMDSSDGLGDAIRQICQCSGVGAIIDFKQVPLCPGLVKLAGSVTAETWIWSGGEDFELVLCLPSAQAEILLQELGDGAAIIGQITSNPEIQIINSCQPATNQSLNISKGFQHF